MNLNDVKQALDSFKGLKIAVVGDVMLDHYLWGNVNRISPEAPVPIVDIKKEEYRLGGATNVVNNLKALGAEPLIFGVVGDDTYSNILKESLVALEVDDTFIVKDSNRPTTRKTRIMAGHQQMIRVDNESKSDINEEIERTILAGIESVVNSLDGIILEDYDKGVLTASLITKIIDLANSKRIPITVDPKYKNFFDYKGVTIFKPNFIELKKNMEAEIESEDDFEKVSLALLDRLKPQYLVVTRGDKGLTVFSKGSERFDIPTYAREVYDVSGAGDTVISTLTLGITSGLPVHTAAIIANHAAGSVCGKVGIQPAYQEDIINSFQRNHCK
ncbi:MAG: D-glycero-beta-D-manno-heptose-7-phosphate kinase [Candidatus Cloacimonadia bacterium]